MDVAGCTYRTCSLARPTAHYVLIEVTDAPVPAPWSRNFGVLVQGDLLANGAWWAASGGRSPPPCAAIKIPCTFSLQKYRKLSQGRVLIDELRTAHRHSLAPLRPQRSWNDWLRTSCPLLRRPLIKYAVRSVSSLLCYLQHCHLLFAALGLVNPGLLSLPALRAHSLGKLAILAKRASTALQCSCTMRAATVHLPATIQYAKDMLHMPVWNSAMSQADPAFPHHTTPPAWQMAQAVSMMYANRWVSSIRGTTMPGVIVCE